MATLTNISELRTQHRDINLILRYAIQSTALTPIEAVGLKSFIQDVSAIESGEAMGFTGQAVSQARGRAFDKLRVTLNRLDIYSPKDLLVEYDLREAEEPYVGFSSIRKPQGVARLDRRQKKAAFCGARF